MGYAKTKTNAQVYKDNEWSKDSDNDSDEGHDSDSDKDKRNSHRQSSVRVVTHTRSDADSGRGGATVIDSFTPKFQDIGEPGL